MLAAHPNALAGKLVQGDVLLQLLLLILLLFALLVELALVAQLLRAVFSGVLASFRHSSTWVTPPPSHDIFQLPSRSSA